ncbi:MAG: hypothetical protein J6A89_07705 [Clostridia bacterium]|nr:hypothetical protein [Clostridia bacterium]
MENLELGTTTLDELISYSKQKESAVVSIIDDVTETEYKYVVEVSNRLRLLFFRIKKSNKIAFINCSDLVLRIAKELKKKVQIMYYDFSKRPRSPISLYAITGVCRDWIITKDNGYVVKAFDTEGKQIQEWINTNIKEIPTPNLNRYGFRKYDVSLSIKGCNRNTNNSILELSRYHFATGGSFNAKRNCYYPRDTSTNKRISRI